MSEHEQLPASISPLILAFIEKRMPLPARQITAAFSNYPVNWTTLKMHSESDSYLESDLYAVHDNLSEFQRTFCETKALDNLQTCCTHGSVRCLQWLIDQPVIQTCWEGRLDWPMHLVVKHGHLDAHKLLFPLYKRKTCSFDAMRELDYALWHNQPVIAQWLLDSEGLNLLDLQNGKFDNLCWRMFGEDARDSVKYLLQNGFKFTRLEWDRCVEAGSPEMLAYIMEHQFHFEYWEAAVAECIREGGREEHLSVLCGYSKALVWIFVDSELDKTFTRSLHLHAYAVRLNHTNYLRILLETGVPMMDGEASDVLKEIMSRGDRTEVVILLRNYGLIRPPDIRKCSDIIRKRKHMCEILLEIAEEDSVA